ncbi:MAG: hypothetical protein ACRDHP_09685 [Ktedonobacterales bacterium]
MKLALIASVFFLDASLDSVTVTWLVGGLVAALVLFAAGVLVTAPARRRERAVASQPAEAAAPIEVAGVSEPVAPEPVAPAPVLVEAAPIPASVPEGEPVAPEPEAIAPAPIESSVDLAAPEAEPFAEFAAAPAAVEFAAPEPLPLEAMPPASVSDSSQPAMPIPVGPDFSASGPIILPASMVAATFGTATDSAPPVSGPLMPPSADAPENNGAPSSSFSGPLMPPTAPAEVRADPAVPFVVTPMSAPAPASAVAPAPVVQSPAANGTTDSERVPLPAAVDLFARSYGRTNAAMLSTTERTAAARIARALGDDPLAVQLAAMYAAETHRSLDGLAQLLETDRRNRLDPAGAPRIVSDADALDLFAASYGRTNAAMLSATERSAAARVVHTLGADALAVRLAGLYAVGTQAPLDRLASRLETDLRTAGTRNGHARQHEPALAGVAQAR